MNNHYFIAVTGSKTWTDRELVFKQLDEFTTWHKPEYKLVLVSGDIYGADRFAKEWANLNNVPVCHIPLEEKRYKTEAGIVRLRKILTMAETVLIFRNKDLKFTAPVYKLLSKMPKDEVQFFDDGSHAWNFKI